MLILTVKFLADRKGRGWGGGRRGKKEKERMKEGRYLLISGEGGGGDGEGREGEERGRRGRPSSVYEQQCARRI